MDIAGWRQKIDEMDRQLVELINRRAEAAEEIGRLKRNTNLPIYEPEREKIIFANVQRYNQGPLPESQLRLIFERIIDVMRSLQRQQMEPESGKANPRAGSTEFDRELND